MAHLLAGAASVNITPPIPIPMGGYIAREGPANEVHDQLYARALVLDDGQTRLAVVTADLLGLYRQTTAKVRGRVQNLCGIPAENLMLACSHTHSGPDSMLLMCATLDQEWEQVLPHYMVSAVYLAVQRLRPARLGVGVGQAHFTRNRRRPWEEGTATPPGPVDPEVTVLRVDDAAGQPLAALFHFTSHAVVLGSDNRALSADFPGAAIAAWQQRHHGATGMFLNGCFGDINPLHHGGFELVAEYGEQLAEAVDQACAGMVTSGETRLRRRSVEVEVPLRPFPTVEEAECQVAAAEARIRTASPPLTPVQRQIEMMYPLESRHLSRRPSGPLRTEIQGLRLGDAAFVGLPGEAFVELGLDIKARSPFPVTAVVGIANDEVGYLPTEAGFAEGGYETQTCRWSQVAVGAGELLADRAVQILQELKRE